ncbi:hypothetical protein [Cohnella sp. 56]|uniref:hypothetical protein n=1 Tax=Cohnella sp. 56 TaxID=3113722 RepID=UPI0030E77FF5
MTNTSDIQTIWQGDDAEYVYYTEAQFDEIVAEFVKKPADEEDRRRQMIVLKLVCDLRNYRGQAQAQLDAKDTEIARLTGRIMQHRIALGYEISYEIEPDSDIRNHLEDTFRAQLAERDATIAKQAAKIESMQKVADAKFVFWNKGDEEARWAMQEENIRLRADHKIMQESLGSIREYSSDPESRRAATACLQSLKDPNP